MANSTPDAQLFSEDIAIAVDKNCTAEKSELTAAVLRGDESNCTGPETEMEQRVACKLRDSFERSVIANAQNKTAEERGIPQQWEFVD